MSDDLQGLARRLAPYLRPWLMPTSGTFTPIFSGSGTAGSWNYSVAIGYYTLFGGRCWFDLAITTTARTVAPTGNALIINLPYAASADSNSHASCAISVADQVTIGGTTVQLGARVVPGTTTIDLIEIINGANAALPATSLSATATIRLSGSYRL